ncbi:MAG TPA: HlyD family secretion protein [Bacteroidia bacterium]|jgi:membrane fusion protein (multidrug efflux system)|nr:HlyD family secretion protein [Bacteroidia bacterium]
MEENNSAAETAAPKKRKKAPFILAGLLLIGGIYATRTYIWNKHHETTEDAQLEGNISPVLPRISGYVNEIRFEDNQFVHKGDTLIVLDDRDLQIKVLQAEAALKNAEATVEVVKSGTGTASATVATAKSSVDLANVALSSANTDYARYDALLKEHAVTQAQFDAVKTVRDGAMSQVDVAKKQYDAAVKTLDAATEQIAVANSVVDQRKADLDYAKLQLSYAVITATMDGQVSKKNVQPGQYVSAGQALFSIVDETSMWVVANFKETQLADMNVGQSVEVKVDAYGDDPISGEVASFSGATGARFALLPPDNSTGNFVKVVQRVPVKILIKADKSVIQKLRPGMSVSVVVNIDDKGK